ncbi:MAG TPA: tannase/feruloyl esterase family alpha/beta hydrolase [Polyangiaceae bacterium]|nr:tannase/feruloyl esterase family alpha/beta hydrolase [Polyangiaceae bacterium]
MPTKHVLFIAVAVPLLASASCHDDPSDGGDPPVPPDIGCADLVSADLDASGVVVSSSEEVAASASDAISLPRHCLVRGSIDERTGTDGKPYAIGFELRLPAKGHNGSLFFQGGGGTDGVVNPAYGDLVNNPSSNALTRGYAVVSTDGGHGTGMADVSFGLDPQARIDYGYNAVGRTTSAAKALMLAFYGEAPKRSYFVGCSNGGRQALVAATRFPDQFDGILAIDPGLHLPNAALAQAWDTRQLIGAGVPGQLPRDIFTPEVLASVAGGILAHCDELDGLEDGIVADARACAGAFDVERDVPTCAEPASAGCLPAPLKTALAAVFGGAQGSQGAKLYAPFPWDPGISGGNWRFWKVDAGFAPLPLNTIVGAGALGYVFTTPPDQPDLSDAGLGYQLSVDLDAAAMKIAAVDGDFTESAIDFMTPPNETDLARLDAHGGKLVVVHGIADPVFSATDSAAWYDALLAADANAADYARLFLVPGMNHCAGGPATDRFDLLPALEAWVEGGAAPESIEAHVNPESPDVLALGWPSSRSRLLCPYPAHAVFAPGAADPESAVSFSCE